MADHLPAQPFVLNLKDSAIFDHRHLMHLAPQGRGGKSHRARPRPSRRPHNAPLPPVMRVIIGTRPSRRDYAIKRTGARTANEVNVRISALAGWGAVPLGRVTPEGLNHRLMHGQEQAIHSKAAHQARRRRTVGRLPDHLVAGVLRRLPAGIGASPATGPARPGCGGRVNRCASRATGGGSGALSQQQVAGAAREVLVCRAGGRGGHPGSLSRRAWGPFGPGRPCVSGPLICT
jgi:hypothetical protein